MLKSTIQQHIHHHTHAFFSILYACVIYIYFPQFLNFGGHLINSVQKLQAAILHLGNVELIDAGDGESSKIANMSAAHLVARTYIVTIFITKVHFLIPILLTHSLSLSLSHTHTHSLAHSHSLTHSFLLCIHINSSKV